MYVNQTVTDYFLLFKFTSTEKMLIEENIQ